MTENVPRLRFIDALRGYAILLVILVHASQAVAPSSWVFQQFMNAGTRGVQLFFIASAWTLCMSWHFRSPQETSPLRNFFLRRFFRIAPLFYTAIAFYVLLYGFAPRYWAPNGVAWWQIPLTALFLNGYHPETITAVVPGGWSIAVEMHFYLLLPFLLSRIATFRASVLFFLVSLGVYGVSRLAFEHVFLNQYPPEQYDLVYSFTWMNLFGQLPVFAIGLAVYFAFRDESLRRRNALVAAGLAVTLISGVIVVAVAAHFPPGRTASLLGNHIICAFALAAFALAVAAFPVRPLVNRAIAHVGRISFSMYISHFAVLECFSRMGLSARFEPGNLSSLLHYACVVAVTACVSHFLYAGIERPGIARGHALIARLEAAAPR